VPGTGQQTTREQLAALGRALQVMYAAVPAEVLTGIPERRWAPAEMCATLRSWIAEPIPEPGPSVGAAARAASSWLGSGEVSSLAGPLAERVFSHADGNLGNFVWDGARCRVVDFEDSGISDPAYEVADLVEHVSAWLPGLIKEDDLIEALGFCAARRARLLGFRRLMAVFWLLMLLPGNPAHRRSPPGSAERQAKRVLALL
jgi:aminoglycoside phosphotransferase (APT) family kinase protein